MTSPTKLVIIARFQGVVAASLAQNKLEEAGIPSFLADAETITTDWLLSNAMGGVKLQVSVHDAERAREVLAQEMDEASLEALTEEAVESGDDDTELHGGDADVPYAALSEREELAQRSWRGAMLSLAFPPMYLLIAWMLLRVYQSKEPLGQPYRRQAWYAACLTVPIVAILLILLYFMLQEVLRNLNRLL